jgi:hypothetical protein
MNGANTVFFLKGNCILKFFPPRPLPIGERGRVRGKSGAKGGPEREILHLEDFRGFILETIPWVLLYTSIH